MKLVEYLVRCWAPTVAKMMEKLRVAMMETVSAVWKGCKSAAYLVAWKGLLAVCWLVASWVCGRVGSKAVWTVVRLVFVMVERMVALREIDSVCRMAAKLDFSKVVRRDIYWAVTSVHLAAVAMGLEKARIVENKRGVHWEISKAMRSAAA